MSALELEVFQKESALPGPHLLVLGAIHGDEVCGPLAIRRVLAQIGSEGFPLSRGKVTFVPVCNPEAYRRRVRFVEQNLNRIFSPDPGALTYEGRLANHLTPLVREADVLLDLHSMQATGGPCVFLDDPAPEVERFVRALRIPIVIKGWPEVRRADGSENESDTITYANRCGKMAVLVECGQHEDPDAADVAARMIGETLRFLGIARPPVSVGIPCSPLVGSRTLRMTRAVFKRATGEFRRPWRHLDPVRGGEVIGVYADGREERAEKDGFILLPRPVADMGQEWFYLGEEEKEGRDTE